MSHVAATGQPHISHAPCTKIDGLLKVTAVVGMAREGAVNDETVTVDTLIGSDE